jgi:hypothetical protein
MDIVFSDARVHRLCASMASLRSRLGEKDARAVAAHLASLRAASCLNDFKHLPGRCQEDEGRLVLALPGGGHLMFEPSYDRVPVDGDGALDWSAIQLIRILGIKDQ